MMLNKDLNLSLEIVQVNPRKSDGWAMRSRRGRGRERER
jgi:pantothenate synthetase